MKYSKDRYENFNPLLVNKKYTEIPQTQEYFSES